MPAFRPVGRTVDVRNLDPRAWARNCSIQAVARARDASKLVNSWLSALSSSIQKGSQIGVLEDVEASFTIARERVSLEGQR
ncbi:MAG: hypothetical protein M3509_10750, partial [Chloroflexota bacterium]|nr:hypothetical protein [Chloroflexota bacterium]